MNIQDTSGFPMQPRAADAADWGDLKMKLVCKYKLERASSVTVKAEFKNADGKIQTPAASANGSKKGNFQELSCEFWVKSGVRSGRLILTANGTLNYSPKNNRYCRRDFS